MNEPPKSQTGFHGRAVLASDSAESRSAVKSQESKLVGVHF